MTVILKDMKCGYCGFKDIRCLREDHIEPENQNLICLNCISIRRANEEA